MCVFAFEVMKWSFKEGRKDLQIEVKRTFDAFQGFAEQVIRFSLVFSGREATQVAKHLKYPTGMEASTNQKSK